MSYSVTATLKEETRKLEGTAPITMYAINASQSGWNPAYYANYNQDIYGFQLNSNGSLTATEQIYTALPIKRDNIQTNTTGEIPELSISIPNTDRAIESVIQNNEYLRGRAVYVMTCFAKHLPSGAAATYIGSAEDKNAVIKEKMYVNTTDSNESIVTFRCRPKFNIKNVIIPGRKFCRECAWNLAGSYLGANCDPSASIASATYTTCDGTLEQCRERSNSNRFGGFPSIPRRAYVVI